VLVVAGTALLLVVLGVAALLSWHFSSTVLVPDRSSYSESVDIESITKGHITLSRSETSERPGYYGLLWGEGHAIVGPIESDSSDTVTRSLTRVRGDLAPETDVGFETNVYAGNPREARGLPYRTVGVPDPLGPMPAWLIPGRHSRRAIFPAPETWAIVVHGHNDDREIGLRIAPTLRRAGLPTLLISYRNDLGAPSSPDGLYHLGETEWQDVAAAARYALAHGARRIVLVGYSMGGTLVAQFMQRSPLKGRVSGVVLDAPALDWKSIFEFNAERMNMLGFFALPLEWAIDIRIDPEWNSLNALKHTGDFQLPVLIFHGLDDRVVPIVDSDKFAAELGRRASYYRVPSAGHTQEWNVNPELYDQRLRRFLLQIAPKTDRARPRGSGSIE